MNLDFTRGAFDCYGQAPALSSWLELGLEARELRDVLEFVGIPLEDADSVPADVVLEQLAVAEHLPVWLRRLPAVRDARSAVKREREESTKRAKAANQVRRTAKARATREGVLCWPVMRDKKVSVSLVRALEALLVREGWLDKNWAPEKGSEEAAWTVRFASHVGAVTGVREVRLAWEDALPLVQQLRSNEAALALAISLRWQYSLVVRVDERLSAPVARRIREVVGQMVRDVGSPGEAGLAELSAVQWRVVARAPEPLRWALVTGRVAPRPGKASQPGDLRALNWDQYKRARLSAGVRFASLPPLLQWTRLTGLPKPAGTLPSLKGLKVGTLHRLLAVAGLTEPAQAVSAGNFRPILNLTQLFGDEASVKRFVLASGRTWDRKGLHDAGQFVLPKSGWTPSRWAPVCLRHPQAVRYAREFAKLEQAGEVPQTLAQLQLASLRIAYPQALPGTEALQAFCLRNKLTAAVFDEAQTFWASVATVKSAEFMPHLKIHGPELGLSADWSFERLASDDFRGPLLGQLTGCCQHLSGAGASCARHGVTSPFSAFYVLTFKGQVFAQSWAWRSLQGGLVWDSIESRPATEADLDIIAAFYREASARLLRGPLQVGAVYLGNTDSGITRQIARRLLAQTKKPGTHAQRFADHCGYADAYTQYLIAGTARKTPLTWEQVENYSRTSSAAAARAEPSYEDILHHYFELDPDASVEMDDQGNLVALVRGRRLLVRAAEAV